ncbi:MAG: hypothetical protein HFG15_02460 [Bacilli bacterium]|nr:hypothetical protein [Bacilli bacterium]
MKERKIKAHDLFVDIEEIEGQESVLVFYEKNRLNQMTRKWMVEQNIVGYDVIDGVANYELEATVIEELLDPEVAIYDDENSGIPLYNMVLYLFNCSEIQEENLSHLEERLLDLYYRNKDHFEQYIEQTFTSVNLQFGKYFYNAHLINEIKQCFDIFDCLVQGNKPKPNKQFLLKI